MAQNEQNAAQQGRRRRGQRNMSWIDRMIANNPNRTPDLLESTSLGPPYVPPAEPSPLERRRAAQIQELQDHLARAVQQREERAGWRRRDLQETRHWQRIADLRGDKLRAHMTSLRPLQQEYSKILIRFAMEATTDPAKDATLDDFRDHLRRAKEATNAPAREYCIVSWFTVGLPQDLVDVVARIRDHHLRTARLRWLLHQAELREGGITRHRDCPGGSLCTDDPDEKWARSAAAPVFGWSFEEYVNGFTSFPHEVSTAAHWQHLRANFEARKVRLEHAELERRWGFGNDWAASLDYRMQMFLNEAIACVDPYFTDHGSLVTEMREYRGEIDARRNIIRDAEKVLGDGLESARMSPGDFTRERAQEVVDEAGIWQQAMGEGVKRAPSTYPLKPEWVQFVRDCEKFLKRRARTSNTSLGGLPAPRFELSSGIARPTPAPITTAPRCGTQNREFVPFLPRADQENAEPASDEEEGADSMED